PDPLGVLADPFSTELSEREIADPTAPLLVFDPSSINESALIYSARFLRGVGGARLDARSMKAHLRAGGVGLPAPVVTVDGGDRGRLLRPARRHHAVAVAGLPESARLLHRARRSSLDRLSRLLAVAAARGRSAARRRSGARCAGGVGARARAARAPRRGAAPR